MPDKLLQSDEARIEREFQAHEKRIRKELEKQDLLRRKVSNFYIFNLACKFIYFLNLRAVNVKKKVITS